MKFTITLLLLLSSMRLMAGSLSYTAEEVQAILDKANQPTVVGAYANCLTEGSITTLTNGYSTYTNITPLTSVGVSISNSYLRVATQGWYQCTAILISSNAPYHTHIAFHVNGIIVPISVGSVSTPVDGIAQCVSQCYINLTTNDLLTLGLKSSADIIDQTNHSISINLIGIK